MEAKAEWTQLFEDYDNMSAGETCEYEIRAMDYREGDLIEIDSQELVNVEVSVYYGKDSLKRLGV